MAEAAQEDRLRLVFMGTPDFAARVLGHVLDWSGGDVIAAYTQPDRPCGRGQVCTPPPVKVLAVERGIPVFQPVNFKAPDDVARLREHAPDVLLVAAYGLILPQAVLDIPRLGPVNVHASLLPRYRGASPIQRALLNGEPVTGITIMRMEAGLDSGPILLQRALKIGYRDTAQTLHDELADLGGRLLVEALEGLRNGRLLAIPQDDSKATYAPKLSKEEGLVDFSRPAMEVHNHIRAMHPWPGAYTFWTPPGGKPVRLGLSPGEVGDAPGSPSEPGTLLGCVGDKLAFACGDGRTYLVPTVTPQGRKPQTAQAFACGYLSRCAE